MSDIEIHHAQPALFRLGPLSQTSTAPGGFKITRAELPVFLAELAVNYDETARQRALSSSSLASSFVRWGILSAERNRGLCVVFSRLNRSELK